MINKRVKISSIVDTQMPLFVREEYPLISEFLSEYYKALDNQSSVYDILQNIDQYVKLDYITNLTESTNLTLAVDSVSNEINVISTDGFPENNGLIKIDDEIIYYKSKNATTFFDCVRGFSGVTSYKKTNKPEELVFSESTVSSHNNNSVVHNLSILFLKEFFAKIKKQILPGFENREFYSDDDTRLNEKNFIIHAKDFYSTKGTDTSFEILFKALYGDPATVIKPRDFLIRPSDSSYKITKDIVVEVISGDPQKLYNRTLFQKQSQGLKETFASITKVEEVIRNEKSYYVLSLDYDYDKDINVRGSIFGEFSIHAKTKAIEYIKAGSTTITVDSTIGFPEEGELAVKSSSGNDLIISYSSKNINQFLNCNIEEDINIGEDVHLNVYAYSIVNEEEIKVRILGVIRDLYLPSENKYYEKGDVISFKSLGKLYDNFKFNDWIVDVPNKHLVSNFEKFGLDQLRIYTYDENLINPFDRVYIQFFDINSQSLREEIFTVDQISQDRKSIYVTSPYNIKKIYYIRKKINTYNDIINNVQNVYGDDFDNVYVVTQGVPDYIDSNIEKRNFSVEISGILETTEISKAGISTEINNSISTIKLNQTHDFKDGDSVVYIQNINTYQLNDGRTINLNIYDGLNQNETYYVQRVNNDELRLFKSPSNIQFLRYNPISFNRLYSPRNLTEVLYTNSEKQSLLSENYFVQSDEFVILFDDENNTEIWYYTYTINQWEKINAEVYGKLYPKTFVKENGEVKYLKNNNLIKKISSPQIPNELEETKPGLTGILMNGVEILNYKSNDFVYYGPIEKIEVISEGEGYDIINLPNLEISSGLSTENVAKAYPTVSGKLERIDVLDGGFDFLEEPKVVISGGNGFGAEAKANLISFKHEVEFTPSVSFVNLANNTISFSTYHKFRNYEEIVYETNGNGSIGGLSTSSSYYISIQNNTTIKLHKTERDAIAGIAITLTSYGTGTQKIVSKQQKKKISSITVLNSGEGYKNNYVSIPSSGINTHENIINAKNHGYSTGDVVSYTCIGTNPVGLNSSNYYVSVVNEDEFQLYPVGIGSTDKDLYFRTNQFVNLIDSGIGTHIFTHEPISIEVNGITGISSLPKDLFSPNIRPIFRGSVKNIFLENGGIGYGTSEILNYEKQPTFNIKTGKNGQLQANILNGIIKEVYVINGGSDYNFIPDLIVKGSGTGCILNAEVDGGKIKKVTVVNGGSGYDPKTTIIEIKTYGSNASFNAKIKKWQINYASRILNSINLTSPDDGILYVNEVDDLKYSHVYCPNRLRRKIYSKFLDDNGNITIRSDYENTTSNIKYHSPIIGWAYDGNPIYGPYGYENPYAIGRVKKMISGYEEKNDETRPPQKVNDNLVFPLGTFIEDYVYTGNGDLDENNGRYCITPEYPNGTYAYFVTLSRDNDLIPQFPYFIGDKYRSKPIEDNFKSNITQNTFDFYSNNLLRNTYFYYLNHKNSNYEFLNNPSKYVNQNSKITSTRYSSLNSIGIVTAGENYAINDSINFYASDDNGVDVSAIVDSLIGKEIIDIRNDSYSISDVEIFALDNINRAIGLSTLPHQLKDLDVVSIISNSDSLINNKIANYSQVGVSSNILSLSFAVNSASQTGIVTDFNVFGNLIYPAILENDYYKIENETVKILKVNPEEFKIRVLREATGTAHTATTKLTELTRKFSFYCDSKIISKDRNKQIYFNPTESVGFGTTSGSTVKVSYTGIGTTSLFIAAGNYYLPNHELDTNSVIQYSSNGGTSIQVSNGSKTFNLSSVNELYAIKISNDIIGISSNRVSIGTETAYAGIGTTSTFLYLTNYGTGQYHSFKSNYKDLVKVEVEKNLVTVSTATTHGLNLNDNIQLEIKSGITTNIKIRYSDKNRVLISNEKYFSGINTSNNIFTIKNHGYYTGQPLVYVETTVSSELTNENVYYVNVIDNDRFRISETQYKSLVLSETIDISNSHSGYFYEINPNIKIIENQKLIFDLSHNTLSFNNGLQRVPAFSFDLYEDENYNKKYYYDSIGNLNVTKTGAIGISSSAKLELSVTDYTPKRLYYKLEPLPISNLTESKKQIYTNTLTLQNNTLDILSSNYSGTHTLVGVGSTSFQYQLLYKPEKLYYDKNNSILKYNTNSLSALGGINTLKLISGGRRYSKLPGISSITTKLGENAIVFPISDDIGRIKSTRIDDIGYDYPIDYTVRPTVSLPKVVKIEPFSTIEKVTTTYIGKNYNYSPKLIVLDAATNEAIQDTILEFDYVTGNVTIVKNSNGFNDVEPKIIPIENSNGVGINTIYYDPVLKRVTAYLENEFLNPSEFPVSLNEKIFVENTSILETDSNYIGYNSADYNYNYFTVSGLSTSVGEFRAYITYNMSEYINPTKTLGSYDNTYSKGSIVPQKNIPTFKVDIRKNNYLIGETVKVNGYSGRINSWDDKTSYAKIQTSSRFELGSLVIGQTTGAIGKITELIDIESYYNIDYYSIVNKGWQNQTGFLNTNSQRLHDNDYYQYFSYSVKSRIPIEKWDEAVSSLNHTSGFKKFSDLSVESEGTVGISTDQNEGNFTGISDLNTVIDLECTYDFDLGTEENVYQLNSEIVSDEISFNSTLLQDHSQSIGNRVLIIDNISGEFNTNKKSTYVTAIDI